MYNLLLKVNLTVFKSIRARKKGPYTLHDILETNYYLGFLIGADPVKAGL